MRHTFSTFDTCVFRARTDSSRHRMKQCSYCGHVFGHNFKRHADKDHLPSIAHALKTSEVPSHPFWEDLTKKYDDMQFYSENAPKLAARMREEIMKMIEFRRFVPVNYRRYATEAVFEFESRYTQLR